MMVGLASLWIPIVLSGVFVFLASSVIHLALRYHWSDWAKLPGEPDILAAFRKESVRPGDYAFPRPACPADMNTPETKEKFDQGPVGFVTIVPSGPPAMGKSLVLWFLYSVGVSFMAAYIASRTLDASTHYLQVFRVVGTLAFLAYSGAVPLDSIWKGHRWSSTIKHIIDGFIYAMLTAGVFGWLWPR
jgi:hypothetical protein